MTKLELEEIIDQLDKGIKTFGTKFYSEKRDLIILTEDRPKLSNERTLASVANTVLEKIFYQKFGKCFMVNEFYLDISSAKTRLYQKTLSSEIVGVKIKNDYWEHCSIDGYFKVENLHISGINHLFVEYKMSKRFTYADLANDFLKYKIYSNGLSKHTLFAFVIIENDEMTPSIINGKLEKYIVLEKTIDKSKIDRSNVYVYFDRGVTPLKDMVVLQYYFDKLTSMSSEYEKLLGESIKSSSEDDEFLEKIKILNKNVVKANNIKINYPFIAELWEVFIENEIFRDDFSGFLELNEKKKLKIISEGAKYYKNFEKYHGDENKKSAIKNGLNASHHTSLNIIIIFELFSQIFEISTVNKPKYPEIKIGRGNQSTLIDMKVYAEGQIERFKEIYKDKKDNIKKLGFSLLYYIVSYYNVSFIIDKNNEIIDEKVYVRVKGLEKQMQKTLDAIFKKLNIDNRFDVTSNDIEIKLMDLFLDVVTIDEHSFGK